MHRSRFVATCAAAVISAVVVVPAALAGANGGGGREVEVTAELVGPDPLHGEPRCDPAGRCLLTVAGAAEVSGDLQGATANVGALMFNSATNTYLTMQYTLFTGTITGCGTGSLMLRSPEVRGRERPFVGAIEVMLGTGTADLRGVSGSGTYTVAKEGDRYVSVWTLELRCPRG